MPHLHGFTKTLRYSLLIPTDIEQQMCCTTNLFRQVVSYCLQIFQDYQALIGYSQWLKAAENLTHRTKNNPKPKYPFDQEYPNLPSGFRRAAISEAYGLACAWLCSYGKWQARKQKFEQKSQQRIAEGKKPSVHATYMEVVDQARTRWLLVAGNYGERWYNGSNRILVSSRAYGSITSSSAYPDQARSSREVKPGIP